MICSFALALSLHLGLSGDYNAVHPHASCCRGDYSAGAFYNSESRVSGYVARSWTPGEFVITAGAVTGYQRSAVIPLAVARWRWLFIAPAIESDHTGVVVGVEIPLFTY